MARQDVSPGTAVLRFGVFEADLESGELLRRGRLVPLAAQSFTVLVLLAARSGDVVTRDELRRALWSDGVTVDYERGLNFCVNRLRRALGDQPRPAHFIETVPRRGYRFLVPVEHVSAALADRAAFARKVEPVGSPRPPQAAVPWRRLATAALVLALVEGGPVPRTSTAHAAGLASPDRIAQHAFDEGRARLDEGPEGWRRSVGAFQAATVRDPFFALAYYGLADAYLRMAAAQVLEAREAYPAAAQAARAALRIEDRAEVREALAAVLAHHDRDLPGARRELARALALDPRLVSAHLALARLASAAGDHAAAIAAVRRAEALAPGCPELLDEVAWAFYRARRPRDAEAKWREWARLEPVRTEPWHRLALLLAQEGRLEESARAAREVLVRAGRPAEAMAAFARRPPSEAVAHYLQGSLRFLDREAERRYVAPTDRASLFALLGEDAAAVASLRKAAETESVALLPALANPEFDRLRGTPPFLALLRDVWSLPEPLDLPRGTTVAAR